MNNNYNKTITALINEFEASSERGVLSVMNDRSYLLLLDYYMSEEIWDRAFEVLEHALNNYSFSVEFYIKKAQLLSKIHKFEDALQVLDQAKGFSPGELEIDLTRAEVFIKQGGIEDAAQILDGLKESDIPQVLSNVYVLESLIHKQRNNDEPIFFTLKSALQLNTRNEQALNLFWTTIEGSKRYSSGKKVLEELIDQDPYSYLFWYYYGHTLSYLGEYQEAVQAYEYAYIINTDFEPAYKEYAELCFELKAYRQSLSCCQEYAEHFTMDSDILMLTGRCYKELGDYEKGRQFLHKALQIDPMDDEILHYLGECYAHAKNWESAIWYFRKAIDFEDKREEYFASIAKAYSAVGQFSKAETAWEEAIFIAPEITKYWLQYAGFLLDNNQGEKALALLTDAEEDALDMAISYGRIACLFRLGRRKEGLFWLREALYEDFESHPVLFELYPELASDVEITQLIEDNTL
jgi:tetratricopeptide (TPR) repeat protein